MTELTTGVTKGLFVMLAPLATIVAFIGLFPGPSSGHCDEPPPAGEETSEPSRVLVLIGGGYHDFTRNTAALAEGIEALDGDRFDLHIVGMGGTDVEPERLRHTIDFSRANLFEPYDVIVAHHQGTFDEFTEEVKSQLLSFIRRGGGYVAIHSAADSHHGWDAYDHMLGGRFESHPPFGEISVRVEVSDHAITRDLPPEWTLRDEFYHLTGVDEQKMLVLMRGRSPGDPEDAPQRPVTWERQYGSGRVFYTILGHGIETHTEPRFHRLIQSAIAWAAEAPEPDDEGSYELFDGRSLDGWSMTGPGEFTIENPGDDGVLLATGGMGMLWYHERRFGDFELTIDWKAEAPEDNSGVFVRFPEPPDSPWDAVHRGHEIQILDAAEGKQMTGAIYNHAPATKLASHPAGQWNTFVITVEGDSYTVVLNGETVCSWTGPADRHGREGYVGLQNHSSPVRFRNVRVRPLGEGRVK